MPWCERCDRFLNPNSVATDGSCPSCGRTVEPAERAEVLRGGEASTDVDPREDGDDGVRAPWHFWVMVAGVVLYLGWRLVEGIFWAAQNWF